MSNTDIEIEIGILNIKDQGFSINETITPGEESQLGYSLNINLDAADNWIEFLVGAEFKDSITGQIYLSGKSLTRFHVRDLKKFMSADGVSIPPDAMTTMFSISFTHTRALLAKNCSGSKFSEVYLPIIRPAEVLKNFLEQNHLT